MIARRLDMKSKQIKNLLSEIESLSNNLTNYIRNSERDFLRNRKLSFFTIIKSIIGMESKSLTNELFDRFKISKRRKKNMTILAVNGFGVEIAINPYFFV